jgi:hypothetical protein
MNGSWFLILGVNIIFTSLYIPITFMADIHIWQYDPFAASLQQHTRQPRWVASTIPSMLVLSLSIS